MTSTTKTKRQIVDFLWDWVLTQGEWSKLLINKIVSTETELSEIDRLEVFNYFLQSVNLFTGLPNLALEKPNYIPTSKQIELDTLSDITGVNRLAKGQTINFSKNITVIFGENGTGKTGYSRILKSIGFSYDNNNSILSNIFAPSQPKSAIIKFKANGVEDSFNWNGTNRNPELENISVFNSSCVQISLCDRQLIVSPIGFHLFNLVSSELNELTKLLNLKIVSHPTSLTWSDSLNIGTPQQAFILRLSGTSSEQKLLELSDFSAIHENELKLKEIEIANLNKTLLQTEIQNLTASMDELDSILSHIKVAQQLFTDTQWQALIKINKQIKLFESQTHLGIKDIAEKNGIRFYETQQFQDFLNAAEEYIKFIDNSENLEYPIVGDKCIYCQQPLDATAKLLIANYRKLLNDKTQEELLQSRNEKSELLVLVLEIETNHIIHQQTFGIDGDNKPIQPAEIKEYNEKLAELKNIFINDKIVESTAFQFNYLKYIEFITSVRLRTVKIRVNY